MEAQTQLNPNLKEFWLKPARNRVLYGGRSSSKTRDTSGFALFLAQALNVRIMCTRQFQSSVERSVYAVLVDQIERFGLSDRFRITNTKIECPSTGSEFLFFGRARNTSEIKGTEDVDIHWAEEAELMTPEEWRIIDATLKGEGSQHWIVFNPRFSSDFVYQRFVVNPPPDTVVRKINYDENPFLSQTQLKVIDGLKNEDIDEFNHVYLGVPLTDDDKVIIKLSWIEAAIDAHVKLKFEAEGQNIIGFDVGDEGDPCANIHAHGSVVLWGEEWQGREDELLKSCIKTYNNAKRVSANIRYDCIGVGAHAGAKFDELNTANNSRVKYIKFNAGDAVYEPDKFYIQNKLEQIKNKDYFSNLKAQTWWMVADRFRNTYDAIHNGTKYPVDQLISISSGMPKLTKLKTELSTPRRDFDQNGRVKVESKKELAKRGIKSPNCFVAGTMIETPNGSVKIETLKIGDSIITPMGISKIIHVHINESDDIVTNLGLTGTADHKIFTWNKGWVPLQTVLLCDKIEPFKYGKMKWQILNLFYTKAKYLQFSERVNTIVLEGIEGKMLEPSDFYTEEFGLITMARFLMAITSTILMVTGVITGLKTWNASLVKNIKARICKKDSSQINTENKTETILTSQEKRLMSGINQKKVENGIQRMQKNNSQKENIKNTNVLYATIYSYLAKHIYQKLALQNAQQKQQMIKQKINANHNVNVAGNPFFIQNSEKNRLEDVPENAQCKSRKVYNITLEEHNVYYANGILVKNCADAFIMCFAPQTKSMVISDQVLQRFR